MNVDEAALKLRELGEEFAVLRNTNNVFPPYEVIPLAPRYTRVPGDLEAVLFDMDGTTTLTEDICLYSLNHAIRAMTTPAFTGISEAEDYPAIIGRSASANMEYLVDRYGPLIDLSKFRYHYIKAAAWNLNGARDPFRRADARATLELTGAGAALKDEAFLELISMATDQPIEPEAFESHAALKWVDRVQLDHHEEMLRAALDLYYEQLHGFFHRIRKGRGAEVAEIVYGDPERAAIAPLPGIGIAFAVARGWIRDEECEPMARYLAAEGGLEPTPERLARFSALNQYTCAHDIQVALVTSSGLYEAQTVLHEVFRGLALEVRRWPLTDERMAWFSERFHDPHEFYDAVITADDSHEIRLKPYRDLYTIAAQQLGIGPESLCNIVGFEDTWAGVMAMRAAGIGVPCAVPFEGTQQHDFSHAAHVLRGGLPEALLDITLGVDVPGK